MSNNQITSLTKEQEKKIPEYVEYYRQVGLCTKPCDKAEAEKAVIDAYAYKSLKPPQFIWADSPLAGAIIAAQIAKGSKDVTGAEVADQASKASYGSFTAYWVSYYAFAKEQLPVKMDGLAEITKRLAENCGVFWTFEDYVVMTERPVAIHMKDQKLHNPEGLALEYKDGFGVFALDGVRYPSLLACAIEASATGGKGSKK